MKEDNRMLKFVYSVFLGVLLAVFVGVGVATFYPGPKPVEYPTTLNNISKEPSPYQLEIQNNFETKMAQHNKDMMPYNRNVSVIVLSAAVVLLVLGLIFERKIMVLSEGVTLGGLFSLIYGIGRGFASQDTKYSFLAVTIGLIIVLYLGYRRFVKSHGATAKK